MLHQVRRNEARQKRHLRVRKKVFGTSERPRFNVFRSLNHMYVQIINDEAGKTLLSASSLDPELKGKVQGGGNIEAAKLVGALAAQRALEVGITRVVFDRAGYLYHGRVAAVAESAREAGLQF